MAVTVQRYIAALPPPTRRAFRALRTAVRAAAPDATEVISYGMPALRLNDRMLVGYAAWKEHVSLYPFGDAFGRAHGIDLSRFKTSKGTIQFPIAKRVPTGLVKRLVRLRAAQLRAKKR